MIISNINISNYEYVCKRPEDLFITRPSYHKVQKWVNSYLSNGWILISVSGDSVNSPHFYHFLKPLN